MSAGEAGPEPVERARAYQEALSWLYGTQRFGIKLGLENMHRLLREMDVPGTGPRIIHVAGTNGKGSVCAMIDSICRTQGYRTGLFTSPHLVTYRERIQVNGELISEEEATRHLSFIRKLISSWEPHPTFFEITTALALIHFKERACELIVLETGLGGRLDATNVLRPVVSVITPIGYDHQAWLGNTLEEIAGEKAGIIKAGIPVASARQEPGVEKIIRARVTQCEAPFRIVSEPYMKSSVALSGAHQRENAALAIAALASGGITAQPEAIARGLSTVSWPARFQRWDARTIIDGAHNPAGARALARTWRESFGDQRATLILAILSDKDVRGICAALTPIAGSVVLPKSRSERALSLDVLAQTLARIAPALQYSITPSLSEALAMARSRSGPILITGSLHFAGEALATLQGDAAAFEECAQ